jgi:DNA-directed RNA polymerase specialized sigma24 family protein
MVGERGSLPQIRAGSAHVWYVGFRVDERLWQLFEAVVSQGETAWPALAAELEPVVVGMAKHQPIGKLRDRDDSPREIVTRVLVRLHKKDFDAIRRLCSLTPKPELLAWLRVLVKRSAIDYMRESPEFARGNANREHRWISLATLNSRAVAQPDTLAEKRIEVLAFVRDAVERANAEVREHGRDEAIARLALAWKIDRTHVRRLVARNEQYSQVLASVLEGLSYPETAERLKLSRREVELTVRYIEDLLEARGFAKIAP